jgi:hypothetical protein
MEGMPGTALDLAALYKGRRDRVDIIDVPELGHLSITGSGDQNSPEFAAAVQALYGVSYAARSLVRRERGEAPKAMPLEALWWEDESTRWDLLLAIAADAVRLPESDRSRWQWQAMIVQPKLIDEQVVTDALEVVRRKAVPAVELVRYDRWQEGLCAQILHVGPYTGEGAAIDRLHHRITANGYRAHGRHHEIYLSDPRRTAPASQRTLIRQPIEPV